jgi:hypothetical protein
VHGVQSLGGGGGGGVHRAGPSNDGEGENLMGKSRKRLSSPPDRVAKVNKVNKEVLEELVSLTPSLLSPTLPPAYEIIRAGHRFCNDDDDEVPVATSEVWTFSPRSPGEESSSPELLPDPGFHVVL